jgi:glycine/D-amino acid oxidase-like deaminating enzyme
MRPDATDENRACWLDEAPPYAPLPPLRDSATADVAVIGGGFTGVSTAWHLSRRFPQRRIVLLEARALANGASGRNGGQALNWINGVETDEPAYASRIYGVTCRGIDLIAELVDRYRLDAGFERRGCLEVYTSTRTAEAAHARVERLRRVGIPLEWLSAAASGVHGAHGAVRDPTAGRVNGVALLRALRPTLLEQGVAVYEQTPVLAIDEGATIRLRTPHGEVRAAAIVLATNAYTPALGYFRHGILPLHSHVVATAPLSDAVWSALGWSAHHGFADDLDRIAYGCRTAGGRLVFGGGGNDAYTYQYRGDPVFVPTAPRGARAFAAIERHLSHYFPAAAHAPIAHRWTGTLAMTLDRVCSMGVRGEHRNVYYALGYSGHGVALAMLAGRVLCDLYGGDHDPWRDLPFYQKPLPRLPPEPLRWIGYQLYTRLTGRSPRRR